VELYYKQHEIIFLDFKICHALNVVFFISGESLGSEFCVPAYTTYEDGTMF
jgi:hypothetical protein